MASYVTAVLTFVNSLIESTHNPLIIKLLKIGILWFLSKLYGKMAT